MRLKAPLVGHVYLRCRLCKRPFRRFKSQIVRYGDGSFCTRQCYFAAWHLFSEALAMEQLEPIFQALAEALKEKKRAA
jgi:hypothetical protein